MRYRVKEVTYKNGDKRYSPQKKFKFWPFWLNFKMMVGPESFMTIAEKTYNEACSVIQNDIEHINSTTKSKILTVIEFNENGIIQRNDD